MSQATRLSPVDEAGLQPKTVEALAPYRDRDGRIFSIWATLAHHEDALRRFLVFGNHVLGKNTLPLPSRELMILRIAARAGAAYEWDQHVRIARRAGLTDDEILRAATRRWEDFNEVNRVLLEATDSLLDRRGVDDDLWLQLRELLSVQQIIDVLYTVGQYLTIATVINTLGVTPDDDLALGLPALPDEKEVNA
jgi:4-carboxymuconolactone decarboxylase